MEGTKPKSVSNDSLLECLRGANAAGRGDEKMNKSYKKRTSFARRCKEAKQIKEQYPNKVPIIIEPYDKEVNLPTLSSIKYLVPCDLEVGSFVQTMRRRLQISESQSLFILVNGRTIPGNSITFAELYENEKDDDDFLYLVFASQEVFGYNK